MRGALSCIFLRHTFTILNPTENQSYWCNIIKPYHCLNIHFYSALKSLVCRMNNMIAFLVYSSYNINSGNDNTLYAWNNTGKMKTIQENNRWNIKQKNKNKKNNNIRGSPNPRATSTKMVTARDIYYDKKIYNLQPHRGHKFFPFTSC